MVGGSVAGIFYGKARLTHDVDCVAFLNDADIRRLPELFPSAEFYLPPPEVIFREVDRERGGHFNIIHKPTTFKADVYPTGRDQFNAWGFRNRNPIDFDGEKLVLAPVEYVIVRKLEYFREGGSEKHLKDIKACLKFTVTGLTGACSTDGFNGRAPKRMEAASVVSGCISSVVLQLALS